VPYGIRACQHDLPRCKWDIMMNQIQRGLFSHRTNRCANNWCHQTNSWQDSLCPGIWQLNFLASRQSYWYGCARWIIVKTNEPNAVTWLGHPCLHHDAYKDCIEALWCYCITQHTACVRLSYVILVITLTWQVQIRNGWICCDIVCIAYAMYQHANAWTNPSACLAHLQIKAIRTQVLVIKSMCSETKYFDETSNPVRSESSAS